MTKKKIKIKIKKRLIFDEQLMWQLENIKSRDTLSFVMGDCNA